MRSWYLLEESVYKTQDASLGIQRHKGIPLHCEGVEKTGAHGEGGGISLS